MFFFIECCLSASAYMSVVGWVDILLTFDMNININIGLL